MKWLAIGILTLLASVVVAVVTLPDPGYVLIGYGNYSMETSLLLFVVLLVLLYLLLRFVAGIWELPTRARRLAQRRRQQRLLKVFNQAVIELADGNLESAEHRLFRLTGFNDAPLDVFLSAARAANRLELDERRDASLKRAARRYPEAETAVALLAAELQLSRGQLEQARTTLTGLQALAPHNKQVLKLVMRLYLELQDWQSLRELLPELQQRYVLEPEQWRQLATRVHREQLQGFVDENDVDTLNNDWNRLPAPVQEDAELRIAYIEQLIRLGADRQAEEIIGQQLKHRWDSRLVYLYGKLGGENAAQRQGLAERWLEQHPEDPVLLLTLGKTSIQNELWGKAQTYFETSIARQPTSEAYRLLGSLLEKLEQPERAAECYRAGVELLDQAGSIAQANPLSEQPADNLIGFKRPASV